MAATNSKPKTFYYMPGFLGGPLLVRGLLGLLRAKGFESVHDIQKADIIIVHSAGCWLLPPDLQPKLLVLIGAALPHKDRTLQTFKQAHWQNLRLAKHQRSTLKQTLSLLTSLLYGLAQPRRNYGLMRLVIKCQSTLPVFQSDVIFIANQHDPWPRGDALNEFLLTRPWSFISLPGAHENLYLQPAVYAEIISAYV